MAPKFIDWEYTANAFFQWFGQIIGEPYDSFALVFCFLAVQWGVLYLMYKKKIFLRV